MILSQQQQPYPSWIPFLGDDAFELKAELQTAQAVTPGQGQTVNIAGVKVGDITEVELVDGHAVVTMVVDQQYAPLIHDDATVLLRPRTGLQDMTLELDPGAGRRADRGGLDDPARPDEAERQPRPDPRLARRRHPGLPEAAARRPAPRPSAGAARSSRRRCAASSRSAATWPRSTARLAERRQRTSPRDHQLQAAHPRRSGAATPGSPTSSPPPTRSLESFADQEASIRERSRSCRAR